MSTQWLRRIRLTLKGVDASGNGEQLDLSQMHITFSTQQMDVEGGTPPSAQITVYNLSDATTRKIQDEFSTVVLEAGYQNGNFGQIFKGTVALIRRGRMNAKDSFLQILAADGDAALRFSVANASTPAGNGASYNDATVKAVSNAMEKNGVKVDIKGVVTANALGGVTMIRGKVYWGLASLYANKYAKTTGATWVMNNGVMQFTDLSGYQDGEVVKLNSNSGMVGIPEATIEGIKVSCLLNPKIQIAGRVQIDNRDINTTQVNAPGYPQFGSAPFFASVTDDGLYRVLVVEHEGDTRGTPWYSNLTCLALDGTGKNVVKGLAGNQTGPAPTYPSQGVPARASGN